ncbi:hypothetical protein HDU93_008794 [Gonapodya sp. JEL0774]|nr:hypothetical protein HDU93_008794 [Gonapodya sp. JEL0774]
MSAHYEEEDDQWMSVSQAAAELQRQNMHAQKILQFFRDQGSSFQTNANIPLATVPGKTPNRLANDRSADLVEFLIGLGRHSEAPETCPGVQKSVKSRESPKAAYGHWNCNVSGLAPAKDSRGVTGSGYNMIQFQAAAAGQVLHGANGHITASHSPSSGGQELHSQAPTLSQPVVNEEFPVGVLISSSADFGSTGTTSILECVPLGTIPRDSQSKHCKRDRKADFDIVVEIPFYRRAEN